MLGFGDFLIVGLALGAGVWFWIGSLRARERALAACRRICREFDMQLLDQTVAVTRLRPARDARGRACLRRRYSFEFSPDGHSRYQGRLEMIGLRPLSCQLDLPDGRTLVSPGDESSGPAPLPLDPGTRRPLQ